MSISESIVMTAKNQTKTAFNDLEKDARKAVGSVSKETRTAAQSSDMLGSSLTKLVAGGALLMLGRQAVQFAQQAVAAYEDSAQAQAQMEAVIRSTGGAAGMTAEDINNLAAETSLLTGVDDDLLVRNQAILLGFTQISKDVFPATLQAAVNLSAAMKQDLQSSIVMVGKAVNDPIQGFAALRRVGIAFSDEQEEMIKGLQESGDLIGAQKVILAELEKEMGGAAVAMHEAGSKADTLSVSMGNLKEQVGRGALPAMRGFNEAVAEAADKMSTELSLILDLRDARDKGIISTKEYMEWVFKSNFAELDAAEVKAFLAERELLLRDDRQESITTLQAYTESELVATDADKAHAAALKLAEDALVSTYLTRGPAVLGIIQDYNASLQQSRILAAGLAGGLSADLQTALEDYDTTLDDLVGKQEEMTTQLIELQKHPKKNAKEIQELNKALEENKTKQEEAAAALQETTREMLFQQAAAGLDAQASLSLARNMGLLSEQDYALSVMIQTLREQFDANNDGLITAAEGSAEYAVQVERMNGVIADLIAKGLPVTMQNIAAGMAAANAQAQPLPGTVGRVTSAFFTLGGQANTTRLQIDSVQTSIDKLHGKTINIDIVFKTTGKAPADWVKLQYQHGGHFIVPPGFPNDTLPLFVSSGEEVDIKPGAAPKAPSAGRGLSMAAPAMGGGGNVDRSVTVGSLQIYALPGMSEETLIDAAFRRLSELQGRAEGASMIYAR